MSPSSVKWKFPCNFVTTYLLFTVTTRRTSLLFLKRKKINFAKMYQGKERSINFKFAAIFLHWISVFNRSIRSWLQGRVTFVFAFVTRSPKKWFPIFFGVESLTCTQEFFSPEKYWSRPKFGFYSDIMSQLFCIALRVPLLELEASFVKAIADDWIIMPVLIVPSKTNELGFDILFHYITRHISYRGNATFCSIFLPAS